MIEYIYIMYYYETLFINDENIYNIHISTYKLMWCIYRFHFQSSIYLPQQRSPDDNVCIHMYGNVNVTRPSLIFYGY